MYFRYGDVETEYLKHKDSKLGAVIDTVGHINRHVDHDIFSSVVHQIIGQQISMKAQASIWNRMRESLGEVSAETILDCGREDLKSLGISYRKADYIRDFAKRVEDGSFDLNALWEKPDKAVISELSALRGVGVWTAQMVLLFSMERPDVFCYEDLGIRRGLCMLYHHRSINRELFEKYRKRYTPYGSVASIYLWEVAGGTLAGKTVL